eukprot:TRINITY_DN47808_c0_g1_i1.p1 TRINITY_DN47808_c0_g1~~TRINITY_DN47808_c0_g1_i1.p1  ORF type:complete len:456 (+),score=94.34 TRINITY_DN47808_c0_g1_i1:35-1369(+)
MASTQKAGVLHITGVMQGKGKIFAPTSQKAVDTAGDCPYFTEVLFGDAGRVLVTKVSADQGVFVCIDEGGGAWAWSSKAFGPVGNAPTRVFKEGVVDCSAGCGFIVTVHTDGSVLCTTSAGNQPVPTPDPIQACDSANNKILLLSTVGDLYQVSTNDKAMVPTRLPLADGMKVQAFSCGSIHSAACTTSGEVFTWGFNQSGCLGNGNRKSCGIDSPCKVDIASPDGSVPFIRSVGCTKGQAGVAQVKGTGQEGPRTHLVDSNGGLYIAGTTHKGLGADHMNKTFMPEKDHLNFYKVGGKARDVKVSPPVPTGAAEDIAKSPAGAARRMGMQDLDEFGKGGCTNYLSGVRIVSSAPAHIHSAALSEDGRLFTWGCGSNGRTGLAAFMRGPGGSKRTMKCYVSTPTQVESIEAMRVLGYATGRWWTLAIIDPATMPARRGSTMQNK